jgi:SAM-dependent methyltransferase
MTAPTTSTPVFSAYAKYYELLYKDKDYDAEAGYVDRLIQEHCSGSKATILELGCGTGLHASLLARKGYAVDGVDRSETMVQQARQRATGSARFFLGDACAFVGDKSYDVVISLFHVLSYQTSNEQAAAFLETVARNLQPGGTAIFDFWYTPAVFTQRPTTRVKRFEDGETRIVRIAEPDMHENENRVTVNYTMFVEEIASRRIETLSESHEMRHFSLPELDTLLDLHGLRPLKYEEWLTKKLPGAETWGVCCIAVKK